MSSLNYPDLKKVQAANCLSITDPLDEHQINYNSETSACLDKINTLGLKEAQDALLNILQPQYEDSKEGSVNSETSENLELNTINDSRVMPYTVNNISSQHEQTNIVECLLDLDNYLEKMDEKCLTDSNSNCFLERNSILRNTIDCTFNKRRTVPEHYSISIYGTLGKQPVKYNNNSTIINTVGDVENEMPRCSFNANKTNTSKSNYNGSIANVATACLNTNGLETLTNDQIFQNLIERHHNMETDRPRQFGRRAERLNSSTQNFAHINYDNLSALTSNVMLDGCHHNEIFVGSDRSITRSSSDTTPGSIECSTDSAESLVTTNITDNQNFTVNEENDCQSSHHMNFETMTTNSNPYWPHNFSRTLALISCTLGLFNINRFAVVTINYGGNFLIQFVILSIIFGIPFLWLQMTLGAKVGAGPISMWKISPICIGIGLSIFIVQYFVTIYSSVAVVWLFIYIQDIFIKKSSYPWQDSMQRITNQNTSHICTNLTVNIPAYFNVNVLHRLQLELNDGNREHFHINDRLAFYMVLLWIIIFVILCKGPKSFGKFILLFGIVPITLLVAVAIKLLCVVDLEKLQNVLSSSEFDDFLVNSKTWTAAAQETFYTWGLLGASIIAMSSRKHKVSSEVDLRKDAILVVLTTFFVLGLSALIGLSSIQILNESGYIYVPGSYETLKHCSAIYSLKSLPESGLIAYPSRFVPHYSTLVGEVYRRHTDTTNVSGYQVLRFLTEVLPAVVDISFEKISWIWTLIVYITFLLFGISQICVMWKPISCVLGNSSNAVLLSCVTGLLLSIPFTTELGITVLYYMDILLGGAWFIPVLWSAEIFGIFLIRGRPYNGDDLVKDLKMSGSMSAFLALTWNIFLPIGLIALAIIEFKISNSNQLYYWRGKSYFNYWSRKTGAFTQIGLLILIPLSAVIQICRYLTSGPPDILDRIQMLYRPLNEREGTERNEYMNRSLILSRYENSSTERSNQDAPPKYTPPPSYTTATGARLGKILRQSFRRSIRRILGETEGPRSILLNQNVIESRQPSYPLNVLPERTRISISESIEFENRHSANLPYGRSFSLGRKQLLNKRNLKKINDRSLSARPKYFDSSTGRKSLRKLYSHQYTAQDVLTVLRSSTLGRRHSLSEHLQIEPTFHSIENLINNSEPHNANSVDNESDQNS